MHGTTSLAGMLRLAVRGELAGLAAVPLAGGSALPGQTGRAQPKGGSIRGNKRAGFSLLKHSEVQWEEAAMGPGHR